MPRHFDSGGDAVCSVKGCRNRISGGLAFFRVPPQPQRMNEWIKRMGREDIRTKRNPSTCRVCAVHFPPWMFINKRLKCTAVPVLHVPYKGGNVTFNLPPPPVETSTSPLDVIDPKSAITTIVFEDEEDDFATENESSSSSFPETRETVPIIHIPETPNFVPEDVICTNEEFQDIGAQTNDAECQKSSSDISFNLFDDLTELKDFEECIASTNVKKVYYNECNASSDNPKTTCSNSIIPIDKVNSAVPKIVQTQENNTMVKILENKVINPSNKYWISTKTDSIKNKQNVTQEQAKIPENSVHFSPGQNGNEVIGGSVLEDKMRTVAKRKAPDMLPINNKKIKGFIDNTPNEENASIEEDVDDNDFSLFKEFSKKWNSKSLCNAKKESQLFDTEQKLFALHLYSTSPKTYKFVNTHFAMPSEKALDNMKIRFKPQVSSDLITLLSRRLESEGPNYKYCMICLSEITLKKNLYYDFRCDEIIGFKEIDGKKVVEYAKNVIVMVLRGCIDDYQQPLGYAFRGTDNGYEEIRDWLLKTINILNTAGYTVNAVVSEPSTTFKEFAKTMHVTVDKPYFKVDHGNVFYIFDVPLLIEGTYQTLHKYNLIYDGINCAQWEHILDFYNKDKERTIKFAPKLTDQHFEPQKEHKLEMTADVLSYPVAAGMSAMIEMGHLPPEVQQTADFILKMDQVFDVLTSSEAHNGSGADNQLECLKNCLTVLQKFKIAASEKMPGSSKLLQAVEVFRDIEITLNSILHLYDQYASKNNIENKNMHSIHASRFNMNEARKLDDILRNVSNEKVVGPTPKQFRFRFSKLVLEYLYKSGAHYNGDIDFECLFNLPLSENSFFCNELVDKMPHIFTWSCPEPFKLNLTKWQNAFECVSSYLLKMCATKDDCTIFKSLIKHIDNDGDMVPDQWFLNVILLMEDEFIRHFNSCVSLAGIGRAIYKRIRTVIYCYEKLCACFPKRFLLGVYVNIRIDLMVKFNNKGAAQSSGTLPFVASHLRLYKPCESDTPAVAESASSEIKCEING